RRMLGRASIDCDGGRLAIVDYGWRCVARARVGIAARIRVGAVQRAQAASRMAGRSPLEYVPLHYRCRARDRNRHMDRRRELDAARRSGVAAVHTAVQSEGYRRRAVYRLPRLVV